MSDACVLADEHRLLGATLADDGRAAPVLAYGQESAASGKTVLCDLSGLFVQLVEGAQASDFVHAAWAGQELGAGEAAFGAVLAGDGATVAVPLAMRTGMREYVLLDGTARADTLAAWLGFLVAVNTGGQAPFASVQLSDASGAHVPLLLCGPDAQAVLADYVSSSDDLPGVGSVRAVTLDGRQEVICVCLAPHQAPGVRAGDGELSYLLLVGALWARTLWRSLLSFPSVTPVGRFSLFTRLADCLPWLARVDVCDRLELPEAELRTWGLVRDGGGFVGGRALLQEKGFRA